MPNFTSRSCRFDDKIDHPEMGGFDMSNWSRNWFYALAACVAASLNVGAGAAAAATLPGIGMKALLVQNDVLPVGYRSRDYDDGYGYGGYYDAYSWATEYYTRLLQNPPDAPPEPAYRRNYDYDNSYDYSDSYDYSNYDNYYYERWPSYTSEPDRYYGTRAPVEAYEKDDYYVWLPPSKPRSCGEYHYWTGFSCVDARYFKPYVGPKW
jgi:hypothetical protein